MEVGEIQKKKKKQEQEQEEREMGLVLLSSHVLIYVGSVVTGGGSTRSNGPANFYRPGL